jgi:hypothetical protein
LIGRIFDAQGCGTAAVEGRLPIGTYRRGMGRRTARSLARWIRYTYAVILLRLTCSTFWVDVRLREINGRWIASADTPDGPSLGLGDRAIEAIENALQPFGGIVGELLATIPDDALSG